eukprot:gene30046-39239_t
MKKRNFPVSTKSTSSVNVKQSSSADADDQKVERGDESKSFGILNIENPSHRTAENYDKSSSYDSPIECTDWTSSDVETNATEVVIISSNNSNTNSTQSSARTVSSSIASEEADPSGRLLDAPTNEKTKVRSDAYPAQVDKLVGDEELDGQRTGNKVVRVYSREKDATSWSWVLASELRNQDIPEESVVNKTYSFHDGSWAWKGQGSHLFVNTADNEGSIPPAGSSIVEGLPSLDFELDTSEKSPAQSESSLTAPHQVIGGSWKAFNLLLVLGILYTALVAGLVIHRCGLQPPEERPTFMLENLHTETVQTDTAELFANYSLTMEYSRSDETESIVTLVQPPEEISTDFVTKEVMASSSSDGQLTKKTFTSKALDGLKNIVSAITGSVGRCLLAIRKALRLG